MMFLVFEIVLLATKLVPQWAVPESGKIIQKNAFMPIFFQQDIDASTRLAIWKIEEDEAFFNVPLQRSITHPHKRLQHLAGRYLLRYLFPQFPLELIRIADTRKPFLVDEAYHFSISHCDEYAAVIVSRTNRVGIDVEAELKKVERIRHKFIGSEEEKLGESMSPNLPFPMLVWSMKEALFKWYGKGGLDFKAHMQVMSIQEPEPSLFRLQARFMKEESIPVSLTARQFEGLCLCFISTPAHAFSDGH